MSVDHFLPSDPRTSGYDLSWFSVWPSIGICTYNYIQRHTSVTITIVMFSPTHWPMWCQHLKQAMKYYLWKNICNYQQRKWSSPKKTSKMHTCLHFNKFHHQKSSLQEFITSTFIQQLFSKCLQKSHITLAPMFSFGKKFFLYFHPFTVRSTDTVLLSIGGNHRRNQSTNILVVKTI